MNIQLIFIFTICVVLPNGLCSSDVKTEEELRIFRKDLLEFWTPNNLTNNAITTDKDGNILMHLAVMCEQEKNTIFVLKVRRIGVSLTAPPYAGDSHANEALLDYFETMFKVDRSDLEIIKGKRRTWKTVKLTAGCLTVPEVLKKLVEECDPIDP